MCSPGYPHDSIVATHALELVIFGPSTKPYLI